MTLYYSMLEKNLNKQLLSHGITAYLTKIPHIYHYYDFFPRTPETASWLKKQEVQYNQTNPQIATKSSNTAQAQTGCPPVYEAPNILVKSPKQASAGLPSRPACIQATSEAIIDCANTPCPINALAKGVVAKIPVVLAELTVQLNVASIIDLPESAYEIKNIKKRLKITQCTLLQNTNILFINGFVRKNIEYSIRDGNKDGLCGGIRHCTVDVPFKCTTAVTYNGIEPAPMIPNSSNEFDFLNKNDLLESFSSAKDELASGDSCDFNQVSSAFYNEMPFCELTSSKIVEFDELLAPKHATNVTTPLQERFFNRIEEKMVIYLTLKILQYRQVAIPPTDC